ncbi:DJ-1/PfpI family protein, partial [Klebsiella pneumoniae]|uniref:DJ-1/PfpI family protein n=1 Tax=Klebsiella pneumoniae TaxID=573 RepID=UPI003857743B
MPASCSRLNTLRGNYPSSSRKCLIPHRNTGGRMSKKIAVLITDDFEDSEFTSPADAYRLAGHEVVTIEKQAGKK